MHLSVVILSLFVLSVSVEGSGIELLQLPEAEHNISSISCIIKMCENYFRSEKAVIGSLVIVNVQNTTDFHSQLIIMLNEHANYELGVMTKDARRKHGNPAHVTDKAKNYFVVFNRPSEVTDAINQWNSLPTWNPLAQVVALFVSTYEDDILLELIELILHEFLNRRLVNVNVISYRYNSNIVQTHTFYPYDGDNCATNVSNLHLIEECEYSDDTMYEPQFNVINPLRPKIPNDLHGCELRIASSVHEPFVFYEKDENEFKMGTEVLMARTISQALKMKPVFLRINGTRENRLVSNETGIYSTLLQRKADILIGGMDTDARVQKILWSSIPYIQDDQTWCVATARPQDLWRNIFGIYTATTWFALIAAIFINGFVIYLFIRVEKKIQNYAWSLLIGMAAALGQYACYQPKRSSIRVLMVFLFLYGLVMSSSFSSFLISILTRPRFKQQIDSLPSAIRSGVKFTGGEVALSHYHGNDEISVAIRDNFEICEMIDDCLKRLINDEKLAVALSRLHALNTPAISQTEIFCFPRSNNIYSYSISMPIKLDFHLQPSINYIIRQLFEFGLIDRWVTLSRAIATNKIIAKMLKSANDGAGSNLVVLTVPHIMGPIFILLFGLIVASITFVFEQIVYRQIKKGNRKKCWRLSHALLNPK